MEILRFIIYLVCVSVGTFIMIPEDPNIVNVWTGQLLIIGGSGFLYYGVFKN
jgi:hypothetical protein